MVLVACNQEQKQTNQEQGVNKLSNKAPKEIEQPSAQIDIIAKEYEGTAVLIGNQFTVLDESNRPSASTELKTGMLVTIKAVSEQKYPKGGSEDFCDQFPYVKIKTDSTETWVLGSDIYEYNEEIQERVISIGRNYYQIKRTRNFGIGAKDEDGFTGCDEYYPLLLKENSGKAYCLISLNESEKNQQGFEYGNIKINEEILSIETDSTKAVFKIDAEYMEDAESYELHIKKVAEGLFEGKIKNRIPRSVYHLPEVFDMDSVWVNDILPVKTTQDSLKMFLGEPDSIRRANIHCGAYIEGYEPWGDTVNIWYYQGTQFVTFRGKAELKSVRLRGWDCTFNHMQIILSGFTSLDDLGKVFPNAASKAFVWTDNETGEQFTIVKMPPKPNWDDEWVFKFKDGELYEVEYFVQC